MKEIWVLSERSDINYGKKWEYNYENYASNARAFLNFETAKTAFRNRISELSKTECSMFHDGVIRQFDKFLAGKPYIDFDEETDEEYPLQTEELEKRLARFLAEPDYEFNIGELPEIDTVDGLTAMQCNATGLLLHEYDDGPINGVIPYLHINCFEMKDPEQHYYLYIEDAFNLDQDFCSSLYLDLRKVAVKE